MKIFSYFLIFIFLLSSCKKNIYTYDSSLFEESILDKNQIFFNENLQIKNLDTLNLGLLSNKLEVKLLNKNLYLSKFSNENSIYDKLFYYGKKKIKLNTFELFSFEDYFGNYPEEQLGFLAVKNNKQTTLIKVFHSKMDDPNFLRSFFSNNYLLILKSNFESNDVVDGKKRNIQEKYCILKIDNDGKVVLLDNQTSNKILFSVFKK